MNARKSWLPTKRHLTIAFFPSLFLMAHAIVNTWHYQDTESLIPLVVIGLFGIGADAWLSSKVSEGWSRVIFVIAAMSALFAFWQSSKPSEMTFLFLVVFLIVTILGHGAFLVVHWLRGGFQSSNEEPLV